MSVIDNVYEVVLQGEVTIQVRSSTEDSAVLDAYDGKGIVISSEWDELLGVEEVQ
jgi:hypothetical protein